MKKPRPAKADANAAMNRTVSLIDGEWDAIGRWSAERGKSRAQWMRECALTVELAAGKARARPLVLEAGEQCRIARTVGGLADDLGSSGDEAAESLADGLRALLAARLRAMVREGRREAAVELLRTVLGEERAAIIAADQELVLDGSRPLLVGRVAGIERATKGHGLNSPVSRRHRLPARCR